MDLLHLDHTAKAIDIGTFGTEVRLLPDVATAMATRSVVRMLTR